MRCSRCLTSPSAGCTPGRGVTTTASSASSRPSSCGRLAAACHTSSPMSPFVTTQPLSKWYELIQEISTYTLSIKNILQISLQAIDAFDNVAGLGESCKEPCVKTVTVFGFPFLSEDAGIDYAYAKLYFKNIVKVTEDHLAYSILRNVERRNFPS